MNLQARAEADSEDNGGREKEQGFRDIKGRIGFACRPTLSS